MCKRQSKTPIIIIGMHRSGTSMITRMLKGSGLFVGWRLDENHEATFFNKHNAWILSACGGRWDTPRCIEYLFTDGAGQNLVLEYLRQRLSNLPCLEYLGPSRLVRYGSMFNIPEAWGWKDPRNTLTLPIWLKLFPNARVISVVRNGVDVAASLQRREKGGFNLAKKRFEKYRSAVRFRKKKGWFGTSPRVSTLMEGFRLWEEYMEFSERFTQSLSNSLLELRYEEFMASPETNFARVLSFCGLETKDEKVASSCSVIRKDRSFAFTKDGELREFWENVRDSRWMAKYGYNNWSEA